jgi:serine/threonine protein kinase
MAPSGTRNDILGTAQYTAPEYFMGGTGSPRSDLFSLGVVTYQMLTGRLPYGARIARARTPAQLSKLTYNPAALVDAEIPAWIDGTLERAVHPNPSKRYDSLSEFLFDLRHPNTKYLTTSSTPLIERNPLLFWKGMTVALALLVIVLLAIQHAHH